MGHRERVLATVANPIVPANSVVTMAVVAFVARVDPAKCVLCRGSVCLTRVCRIAPVWNVGLTAAEGFVVPAVQERRAVRRASVWVDVFLNVVANNVEPTDVAEFAARVLRARYAVQPDIVRPRGAFPTAPTNRAAMMVAVVCAARAERVSSVGRKANARLVGVCRNVGQNTAAAMAVGGYVAPAGPENSVVPTGSARRVVVSRSAVANNAVRTDAVANAVRAVPIRPALRLGIAKMRVVFPSAPANSVVPTVVVANAVPVLPDRHAMRREVVRLGAACLSVPENNVVRTVAAGSVARVGPTRPAMPKANARRRVVCRSAQANSVARTVVEGRVDSVRPDWRVRRRVRATGAMWVPEIVVRHKRPRVVVMQLARHVCVVWIRSVVTLSGTTFVYRRRRRTVVGYAIAPVAVILAGVGLVAWPAMVLVVT